MGRYKRAIKLIKEKIPDTKKLTILDVGVGKETTEYLDLFKEVHTLDVDEKKILSVIKMSKGKIKYSLASGNKLPFKDKSFDVVSCVSTLDHVPNPKKAFEEVCRVAKKYVLIGQGNNLLSIHVQKYFAPITSEKPKDHLGHMCWIPFWKLQKLAKKEKLTLIDTNYWGMPISTIGNKLPSISINLSRFYFALYKK